MGAPHSSILLGCDWLAWANQFGHKSFHCSFVVALSPHEVDLVYLLLILDKPPKTLSKLLLHEVRIVSLADVALVVDINALLINLFLIFRHRLNGLLINHVIELIHVNITFSIKAIFSHKDSINEKEKLFFDKLLIVTLSHRYIRQLCLSKVNSHTLTNLNSLLYMIFRISFCGPRLEHELCEFIVISKHTVYRMVPMFIILAYILNNFYFTYLAAVNRPRCC